MMRRTLTLTLLTVLPLAGMVVAKEPYGHLLLERGAVTVLRDGATHDHREPGRRVPVFREDLVRVRQDSRAVLRSPEKAAVTLGSNAIFQLRDWETERRGGTLRMVYGRVFAAIKGLAAGEAFNTRTATAVVGVKGTEYTVALTSNGDVLLIGEEHVIQLVAIVPPERDVAAGAVSVVLAGRPATPPAPLPEGVRTTLGPEHLDAPLPMLPAARRLPGEAALVEAGIVTEEALERARREEVPEALLERLESGELDTVQVLDLTATILSGSLTVESLGGTLTDTLGTVQELELPEGIVPDLPGLGLPSL